MYRYCIQIEYDGRGFVGWQRQKNGLSVQEVLEEGIYRLSGEHVTLFGAGRTDSGVHALGQVAHFDLPRSYPDETISGALNFYCRKAHISIVSTHKVAPDFHARFSAIQRYYLYKIINREAPLTFMEGLAWHISGPLDYQAMHHAAQNLIGHHDFTTFRHARCQAKSPCRTLEEIAVSKVGEEILIYCRARSFLHRQVRSIAGSLSLIGKGKWSGEDLAEALAARKREACGPVAPACGLYLTRIDYKPAETT